MARAVDLRYFGHCFWLVPLIIWFYLHFFEVNLVQEACIKHFSVHVLKFEVLQTTWKNKTKNVKMLILLAKNWKERVWCSLLYFFFHVICKISNFDKGTIKHLAKASSTEMTWTIFEWPLTTNSKVHIFWEGPIILRNLHLRKTYLRWRFPKIFGPSQNIWTLPEN